MIVRDLPDGSALIITQESHADLAAQFAAHWGNERFERLPHYGSMLFGTTYHDSGHREMEATLAVDPTRGLPYNFRGAPAAIRHREADGINTHWIGGRDPYAALVVSMHLAGLMKRRYDTVRFRLGNGARQDTPPAEYGLQTALAEFDDWQRETAARVGLAEPAVRDDVWHNFQMLQVFDTLSLYFCCDGYTGEALQPAVVEQVPLRQGGELVDLTLTPIGGSAVRITPYPFDVSPLEISAPARQMRPNLDADPAAVQEAYYGAPRRLLTWQLSA
jgi:hypothetical protein